MERTLVLNDLTNCNRCFAIGGNGSANLHSHLVASVDSLHQIVTSEAAKYVRLVTQISGPDLTDATSAAVARYARVLLHIVRSTVSNT